MSNTDKNQTGSSRGTFRLFFPQCRKDTTLRHVIEEAVKEVVAAEIQQNEDKEDSKKGMPQQS